MLTLQSEYKEALQKKWIVDCILLNGRKNLCFTAPTFLYGFNGQFIESRL